MKFCKKTLSFILAFVLMFSTFTPLSAISETGSQKTTIEGQELVIGDKVYYIFSTDRNAKSDLIKAQEKGEVQLEELQASDGLEISGGLHQASVGAGETTPYTLNIKGNNFIGVGGKTFDWDTLPNGLELQVFYIDENFLYVNVGNPITINEANYQDVTTRTYDIAVQPYAFGMKTNVDTETYLTDVYLTNENSPEPGVGSLDMTFDLVQVPSTKLDVKWVDGNRKPLAKDKTPATILKDILTFNFIENRKFDLPNYDKEESYFRLINKIERKEIKDMQGATALIDGKKDGEEVILDGKTYKLEISYKPAYNVGSTITLIYMNAADKITAANLKAVDTTALQGQDLTEEFWHKGVALADNTPADKKDAFEALLKDATVTDITEPARTTAEAGEKVGTLKVTFKDGSTLEVPNQKLIVKPNTIEVSFDNEANDDANAPRHKETLVKGKVTSTSGYPVKGAKVEIKDEAGNVIGITQVTDDEGNFKAGTRELKAGEKLTASVTLPDSKHAAESTPKTVKLNPDRLNELLPIAKAQKDNFSKKQNAIIKERLKALEDAITTADPLVDAKGKATATDTAENQTAIDNAVEALEDALKALTANIPPSISGPKAHEIFVGEDLDLKSLVEVTDGDGAEDLVAEADGSKVQVKVVKVDGQTETPVTDLSTINTTVGTYKVTYTAKDQSDAEVTHEMTLTVKPRTASAIEVTTDPTNMSYLIKEKNGTAKLNLAGMTLNLVDNLGKKTPVDLTDSKVKLKLNGRDVTNGADLTLKDDVQFIEVEYTPDGSQTPLTAKTDGVLRVGPDYDGDGKDDRTQDFDPKNIKELEVIKQPQLDYIAKDKSEDSKFKLNLEGMIVRMTDKAGKEKLAVVKDGKFVDYDDNKKAITVLTATPAHDSVLKPQTSDTEKGDNGKTVKITGPNNSEALTEPLKVFYDANKDGTPDYKDGQKTPAPSAMARNIGKDPKVTTVEGMATPGAVIKITDKDGTVLTTEPTEVVAGPDGKYTATVKPILADGTDIKVTAKLGEMGESDPTPAKVFDDKNDNKQPDRDEGFNIEKATDIKFVDQPDLTYLVATKDKEVTFDGKDAKGKAIYLELSYKNGDKTESKIMTLEELMKDADHIAATPVKDTKDKIENKTHDLVGKNLEVKLVKANKTATSTSKFAIEIDADGNDIADKDEKTPAPTAEALNVGKEPTSTTITGKAVPGAKVVAKVGEEVVGEAIADAITGEYTIEAKQNNAALPKDTKVNVTAKDGEKQTSDPTDAIVKEDKDGNGVDDEKEKFDIKKATKVEIIKNPDKMDYLVNTPDGKAKFETNGLVVKFTDDSGKSATYTAEELAKMEDVTIKPANNEEIGLTPEGKTNKMDLTVTVTGAEATDKPTAKADRQVIVKLDADKNGTADEDEQTPEPTVTARNIGTEGPDGKRVPAEKTTVEIETEPNADVTIEYKDANNETKKIVAKADDQGKLTKEITPKLEKGTPVKVTVQDGEKKPTNKTVKVFDDLDADGQDDSKAGQTERPSALAYNFKDEAKTTIKGEAEPGATVVAKVGTVEVGKTIAGADGKYTIYATKDGAKLPKGTKVSVTATLAPKGESPAQETVVYDDLDGDGQPDTSQEFDKTKIRGFEVVASPDKMVYNNKENLILIGMKVKLTDQMGNMKIVEFSNFEDYGITVNPLNNIELSDKEVADGGNNGQKIKATINVTIGNSQKTYSDETPTALTVNKDQSAQPTDVDAANQGKTPTETKIKGKAKKGDTINIYAPGQVPGKDTPIKTVKVTNDDGTFETSVRTNENKPYDVGTKFNVTAIEPGKTESAPQEAKVFRDKNGDWKDDAGKVELEKPIVDPIKVGDTSVKVQTPGEGITKITVKDEKGKTIEVVKDGDDWKVDGKAVQKDGTKLIIPTKDKNLDFGPNELVDITNHDAEGNEGKTVVATKPANLKPMENPTIDPISTQSTKITGKSLPGSKVLVYLPGDTDETAREASVKSDGSFELNIDSPLADKSVVKVKATNSQRDGFGQAETKVGLNLQELEKTDVEADKLINDSKTDNNFDPENNKYDKNLEEKSKAAKEVLEKAKDKDDNNDPTQTKVNDAEKELREAINQKNADDKVKIVEDKVKAGEKPSDADIDAAQDAIDKVTDPTAKKELQDRLDLVKKIKEGEDRLEQDDVTGNNNTPKKPQADIDALKKAVEDGKKAIDSKDSKTKTDATEVIQEALDRINKEHVVVSIAVPSSGFNSLSISSLQANVKIKVKIDGIEQKFADDLYTSPEGKLVVTLGKPLESGQKVEVIGSKPGLIDGGASIVTP